MPIHQGIEQDKQYFQYGQTGKKYYFTTEIGKQRALHKAKKQMSAINLSKHRAHMKSKLL